VRYIEVRKGRARPCWVRIGLVREIIKMEIDEIIKSFEELSVNDLRKMDAEKLEELLRLLQDISKISLALKKQVKK